MINEELIAEIVTRVIEKLAALENARAAPIPANVAAPAPAMILTKRRLSIAPHFIFVSISLLMSINFARKFGPIRPRGSYRANYLIAKNRRNDCVN